MDVIKVIIGIIVLCTVCWAILDHYNKSIIKTGSKKKDYIWH